ncbi:hypothetical protein [Anoxynatronum sibiricum]|uniref:N-acetyltransferase domain-containing protein n=1 Tax=Anoxynatronum sibiricum TaxID=210623 RepID=A0ABU9VW14_9CLOT
MTMPQLNLMGWTAAILIIFSLLTQSLFSRRWLAMLGTLLFVVYTWQLRLYPLLTVCILLALVSAWYVMRVHTTQPQEFFQHFDVATDSTYLKLFLDFHQKELKEIYPDYSLPRDESVIAFFVLRNLVPAGIFVASEMENHVLYVHVDFVIPRYRDYKIARYMYEQQTDFFLKRGYTTLWTVSRQLKHTRYLNKMGFRARSIEGRVYYVKDLRPPEA